MHISPFCVTFRTRGSAPETPVHVVTATCFYYFWNQNQKYFSYPSGNFPQHIFCGFFSSFQQEYQLVCSPSWLSSGQSDDERKRKYPRVPQQHFWRGECPTPKLCHSKTGKTRGDNPFSNLPTPSPLHNNNCSHMFVVCNRLIPAFTGLQAVSLHFFFTHANL